MNVPKLRFKEFNDEWIELKYKNIFKVNQGLQIPISNRYLEPGINRYFYITNEFLKPNTNTFFYIENPPKNVICSKDDILMTRTGNTGKVVTNVNGVFHNNFFIIKYNPLSFSKNFIYYLLNQTKIQYKILSLAGASTIPDLNHRDFYSIKSKFPSIQEQEKIADFLSTVDKKIENLNEIIENLEQQKKGLIQQIFSQKLRFKDENGNDYPQWQKKKIGDLFTIKVGGDISKENLSEQYSIEFKYPVFANTLTNNGLYGYSNIYKIDKPSITVTGRGINVGFALSRKPFYYPIVRLLVLIPNMNINFTFFTEIINFIHIFNESTGVPQLTVPQLSKVNLFVPIIKEQNKIGNLFDKLNEKIDNQKVQLEHWQQIKKGLLQQMFI